MDVRDAVEADAERLGELADSPRDVMRNLVHDRTVRVTVEEAAETKAAEDTEGADGASVDEGGSADDDGGETDAGERVTGFVSFDAREGTVHVTQLAGDGDVLARLLEEPVRFAEREGMDVELLVPEDEGSIRAAAEEAGFSSAGSGPRFEGTPTTRYRLEAGKARQ